MAKKDSEYDVAKKMEAGLMQNNVATMPAICTALSLGNVKRSVKSTRHNNAIENEIVLINSAERTRTPSNVGGKNVLGRIRIRISAPCRITRGNKGKNACACSESRNGSSIPLDGSRLFPSAANVRNRAASHFVMGCRKNLEKNIVWDDPNSTHFRCSPFRV
ncbi:hypothetical protein MHU86_6391 [Fragilaria crotonensis]|nr:hypothetical protein MHU86_6391 [Fragilaria crotonensis]